MPARATRIPRDWLVPDASGRSVEIGNGSTIVGFDMAQGCVEHLSARNDDYVYAFQWFTTSKQLADEAFRAVSGDRVADFLAGGDTEARRTELVQQGKASNEPAAKPGTPVVHARE